MPKRITFITLLDLNDAFVSFVFCAYMEFLKIVFRLLHSTVQEPESWETATKEIVSDSSTGFLYVPPVSSRCMNLVIALMGVLKKTFFGISKKWFPHLFPISNHLPEVSVTTSNLFSTVWLWLGWSSSNGLLFMKSQKTVLWSRVVAEYCSILSWPSYRKI